MGFMRDRVLRDFSSEDLEMIVGTFRNWRGGQDYGDEPGFCYSASLEDIRKADFVLTPGRYVGAAEEEEDGEPFAEKIARLRGRLDEQFVESAELEKQIKQNLNSLGI
jgi:type I restriction enzyme M protein